MSQKNKNSSTQKKVLATHLEPALYDDFLILTKMSKKAASASAHLKNIVKEEIEKNRELIDSTRRLMDQYDSTGKED